MAAQLPLFDGPDEMPTLEIQKSLKPPLKWAGGKRWQVPLIHEYWRRHSERRLVEPFCGGLAVTLGVAPRRAFLNDVNPHLINFYKWLKRGLKTDLPMKNCSDFYYVARERFNLLITSKNHESAEAASLFYYLNRTGFNGLCRFNQSGIFNVPFGRYKTINYQKDFSEYSNEFKSWTFAKGPFHQIALKDDDFVYADPPYDVPFTTYSAGGFTWEDQVRTAEWLAEHPGPVVLSNQATSRILKLYRKLGFAITLHKAPRRISCTGDRTPATEVIAIKNIKD